MSMQCEAIKPNPALQFINPLMFAVQNQAYEACKAQTGPTGPAQPADYIPLAIGVAGGVGILSIVGGVISRVLTKKKVITEHYDNQPAPGDFDRFRRQFSDARTGLKEWAIRHKRGLKTIAGISVIGLLLGASQASQTTKRS